jgi:hypothetical protein
MNALTGTLLLAGTAIASAQDVVVTPEEQTVIHEYVTKQHVEPITPPSDVEIAVGSTLPDSVEVHSLDVPEVKHKYSYVVVGKRTVLVEPETRKIVQIIE